MNQLIGSKQQILKVSELTKKVRFILENELNTLWLSGEISNFMAAGSGHWYLSLKDSKAQVKCAMFKGNNRFVKIKPENGQQVLVKAKVSLYEPRGDFQLIIEQMEDAGEGLLRQKFEQIKAELQMEGLFDNRYKQPIPEYVQTVGLVTSSTGAAIKDILSVLNRRSPTIKVIIYPTLVQGDKAAEQISDAIYTANERDECDVLIVGRGGGSLEDLWAFNEEAVVRAIFDCDIPVISAVGHEIDTSLSDYAADVRAPTPSAAAELVSNDNLQLKKNLLHFRQRLVHLINSKINASVRLHQQWQHKLALTHPEQKLQKQQQLLDELHIKLVNVHQQSMGERSSYLELLQQRLNGISLNKNIQISQQTLTSLTERLQRAQLQLKDNKQQKLATLAQNLNIMSPLATISRGYTISRNEQGQIITTTSQVKAGEKMLTQLEHGAIESVITQTSTNE